jgi:CBS domain-containing protein
VRPTETLAREHQAIKRVLDGTASLLPRLRAGEPVPERLLAAAIDFFAAFVHGCHERKEEALFPLLGERGLAPPASPLGTLAAEHRDTGTQLGPLRAVPAGGWRDPAVIDALAAYVTSIRRHLGKERRSLFKLADRVLSPDDERGLEAAFGRLDELAMATGGQLSLRTLAEALERACRELTDRVPPFLSRHVMHPRPRTVQPANSLAHAAELMDSIGARELPVVEGDSLVGILARRDLEPHHGHYEWTPVRAAMTADPVTVHPDMPLRIPARLLVEHGFNGIPVAVGRALVGMIRRADLLQLLV